MIPNAHITIYNKYIQSREEKYQRAQVFDCVWQSTKAVSRMREMTADNTALILIPFTSSAEYVEPKMWQATRVGWTLQEGDVIVRGLAEEEIADGFTVTDLRNAHEFVVTIASVDAMDQGSLAVQHFEVQAK
jgi:hypothetical protein